jgi:anion-transporting  ArsA/GET3 family ATPase
VSLTFFDGADALAEYLRRKMHLGRLADTVVAHPLYQAFVQAAPGVKELMAIGKVRDELVLKSHWDVVIVDAGASGHALAYLRMPAATRATFRRGRVHREAGRVHALLADPVRTAVHVVATPEEMPVLEAIETTQRLRDELGLPLGRIIVNRHAPPAPAAIAQALDALASMPLQDAGQRAAREQLQRVATQRLGWLQIQARSVADLEAATHARALLLPLLSSEHFGIAELSVIANALAPELT